MVTRNSSLSERFLGKDVPVLFLDTCIILDMIRDPTRRDVLVHEHKAFLTLLQVAESGKKFVSFIAEQVAKELQDNLESVQKEARQALLKFRDKISKVDQLARLYGTTSHSNTNHLVDHEIRCRQMMERWINTCAVLLQSERVVPFAFSRVNQARTPARKGKDSMKDCVILETYLDFLREFRSDGLKSLAVFVSSNKKDYAATNGAVIRDDIRDEFESLGLEYAPNMAVAKHMLNL